MSAVLLTRLKITDLTAITALEAGRRMLPEGYALERLVREEVVLFEPETGAAPAAFEQRLHEAIETSNFFVNPNKERFRFLTSRERGDVWAPPEGAWGILARTRDDTRDEGLRARLLREHPLPGLAAIRRARVWWLWTRGPGGDAAREDFYERLGPLQGPSKGLLLNPHAEASLRIFGAVAWKDVERFLAEPALQPAAA
ncbi:MAG TPA: hypothetical protein VFU59_06330 [Candidatus Eisenbacteria bacterium]|nr:hypothetical protein [Candidatus Eisenbacteria bacterium]